MKKLISTASIEGYELRYFMTETESEDSPGKGLYGVYVEMYEDGVMTLSNHSGTFTEDKEDMENVIAMLCEGTVMPDTLLEVLDEIVDQRKLSSV